MFQCQQELLLFGLKSAVKSEQDLTAISIVIQIADHKQLKPINVLYLVLFYL